MWMSEDMKQAVKLHKKSKKEGLTLDEFNHAKEVLGVEMSNLHEFDKAMKRNKKEGLERWM